jgi:hypothetical protein
MGLLSWFRGKRRAAPDEPVEAPEPETLPTPEAPEAEIMPTAEAPEAEMMATAEAPEPETLPTAEDDEDRRTEHEKAWDRQLEKEEKQDSPGQRWIPPSQT